MVELRIVKYPVADRSPEGIYYSNEWTSVSDIGKEVDAKGEILTLEEYLRVESQYVAVAEQLVDVWQIRHMRLSGLEVFGLDCLPADLVAESARYVKRIKNGMHVSREFLPSIVRLALREVIWCRIRGNRRFYLDCGYDYYMCAGFAGELLDLNCIKTPLSIDRWHSP